MTTRDEILLKKTYKSEKIAVSKRVAATLGDGSQIHRVIKTVSSLIGKLHSQGVLSDDDIDDLLLDTVA